MTEDENDTIFNEVPSFRESEQTPTVKTFTDDERADFRICFSKYDVNGRQKVESHEIGSLIRATGLNPTMKEVTNVITWLSEKNVESFTFDQFVKLLEGVWVEVDHEKVLEAAFKAIDKEDAGYLSVEQLRDVLQGYGEKLDDDDFKEFIKNIPVQTDGNINNSDLISLFATPIKPV